MDQKLRILIVDDDRHMTHTLSDILSIEGHDTVEAFSGPEALERLHAESFDCVLTDVKMPGIDGIEFYRRITLTQPGLPVMLMTAYASQDIIRKGLDEGVVGVFEKPLDISHVLGFFGILAKKRWITIVDDDPFFCKGLGDILHQRGFQVIQVTDPNISFDEIVSNSHVLLLDVKLDRINGLDILKSIRIKSPQVPVILITGYYEELAETIQQARDFNATICLHKPLEIGVLLQMLTQLQLGHLRSALNKP